MISHQFDTILDTASRSFHTKSDTDQWATVRYSQIEAALVKIHRIAPDNLGAFQARIRHLRRFDCPAIAKARRGAPAEYSRDNAIELALALEFSKVAVPPKQSAFISGRLLYLLHENDAMNFSLPVFAAVTAPEGIEYAGLPDVLIFKGYPTFDEGFKIFHPVTIINVSALVNLLDDVLADAQ